MNSLPWDHYFLNVALVSARMSKDPSTQVGAVLVGDDREIVSSGFNGFPRAIKDDAERYNDRDVKLTLTLHAEVNAIVNAARLGLSTRGRTLYLIATDATGQLWGGPPCTRCTMLAIQAGITEIVTLPFKIGPSKWADDIRRARGFLDEARIHYREALLTQLEPF